MKSAKSTKSATIASVKTASANSASVNTTKTEQKNNAKTINDFKMPLKKDGTQDNRYTAPQFVKKDGTRDMRTTNTNNR